jgi:ribosome biogenesis GTPase
MKRHGSRPKEARESDGRVETGLVIRLSARHAVVQVKDVLARCSLRKGLFGESNQFRSPIAVGDRVRFRIFEQGEGVVEEILPRRGYLSRWHAATGKEQVMLANLDQVLITVSLVSPAFRPRLIDRVLVAAGRGRFDAAIIFTKTDLVPNMKEYHNEVTLYEKLGYPVLLTSTKTGAGIEDVRKLLADRVSVVAGQSGVGKSTLLNAVQPELGLRVAEISARWGKGVHTTTAVSLHSLTHGGWVADTPGIRSFGIAGLEPCDVALFLREFEGHIDGCRYPSCTHDHEPHCAVKTAVLEGSINPIRYESYLRIIHGMDEEED